jgi:hypothetical protein
LFGLVFIFFSWFVLCVDRFPIRGRDWLPRVRASHV